MIPIFVPIIATILGILTFGYIHRTIKSTGINYGISQIIVLELASGFLFAYSLIFYVIPAGYYLLLNSKLGWTPSGFVWRASILIGTLIVCVSSVGWVPILIQIYNPSNKSQSSNNNSVITGKFTGKTTNTPHNEED